MRGWCGVKRTRVEEETGGWRRGEGAQKWLMMFEQQSDPFSNGQHNRSQYDSNHHHGYQSSSAMTFLLLWVMGNYNKQRTTRAIIKNQPSSATAIRHSTAATGVENPISVSPFQARHHPSFFISILVSRKPYIYIYSKEFPTLFRGQIRKVPDHFIR